MNVCKSCGTANSDTAVVCKDCGASLRHAAENPTYYEDPDELIDGVEVKYLRAFTGRAANHYLRVWKRQAETGKKTSFNGWAMIFSIYWFLARRMVKTGVGLSVISFCLGLLFALAGFFILSGRLDTALAGRDIEPITYAESYGLLPEHSPYQPLEAYEAELDAFYAEHPEVKEKIAAYDAYQELRRDVQEQTSDLLFVLTLLGYIIPFVFGLVLGLFGDHLYFRYAKWKIHEILKRSSDDDGVKLIELRNAGGVKPLNVVIGALVIFAFNNILSLL